MSSSLKKAESYLFEMRGKKISREERVAKTLELTALLIDACHHEKTHKDKQREAWFARMTQDPKGRTFMTTMTDRCFRSHSEKRTADQLVYLIKQFGIPRFLHENDRLKFRIFSLFGQMFPNFFIPIIRKKIQKEMASVLLPEEPAEQMNYFNQCRKENIHINLNHLGEAILGEKEAANRLNIYLEDLANPLIEYVSIKISTIYSQINMIGFTETLDALSERLKCLYKAAKSHKFKQADGSEIEKFVNLDMEEYKDLDLTVAAFQRVLSEPEFLSTQAGIVLQSYLPDAFAVQKTLTQWARERLQKGGAPIKIRLVKGANLAMETVESSICNWKQAPFETKIQTDANFKRMLEFACIRDNAQAAHIGVGSHNLFDIAYPPLLRVENKTENFVSFEMLEGMAKSMRNVIKKLTGKILLYCPEAKAKDFHTAVAYLIRRLDENSGPQNFLRHFFELRPENQAWRTQVKHFVEACRMIDTLPFAPNRTQNRTLQPMHHALSESFENEADTDFSLKENRKWADEIYVHWKQKQHPTIPLVIAAEEIISIQEPGIDPSNPGSPFYYYSLADVPLVEKALSCASENQHKWGNLPFYTRSKLLKSVAQVFREKRGELIGAMIANAGKTVLEADPEVSEAIDFIEYYRQDWEKKLSLPDLKWSPKGTVLVAPPWNFPCSIPVGGIAAALTSGNCVLFKPAPEATLIGWYVAQAFWEGGIPRQVLQFINCKDEPIGNYLIKHPKISSVILTGSTLTARKFLKLRPGLDLHAETGGKNAIIVTAMCDRDLAVRDLINSAFGHSGQKCSACSLAILEAEVYEDHHFKNQLLDAARSLKIASAWDKSAKITPLIRQPEGALYRGLTQLEEGESWALEPKPHSEIPNLWSPGIKWGVQKNSFTHQTEFFGPILGIMRAQNLDEAIRFANGTPYGLTSGLHSLDEREQEYWKTKIQAGNLYINRSITGAIVRRQPFGGCKASSYGSGAKAGGPNYVHQFALPAQIHLPHEKASLPLFLVPLVASLGSFKLTEIEQQIWKKSAENYAYWAKILKKPIDLSLLIGQDNYFYHIPLEKVYARFDSLENLCSLLQVVAACLICQTPLEISTKFPLSALAHIPGLRVIVEEEASLLQREPSHIRLFSPPSPELKGGAAEIGAILNSQPVLANGRFELLHYLREISLSFNYHRYGYLGCNDSKKDRALHLRG